MTDDDHTLDADDDMLDELRRLAADAKASGEAAPTDMDTDATVDADDSTMEELRRFAAEARAAASADNAALSEPPSEATPRHQMRPSFPAPPVSAANDAIRAPEPKEADTVPLGDIPDLESPPAQARGVRPPSIPDLAPTPPRRVTDAQVGGGIEATRLQDGLEVPMVAPGHANTGGGWRPPPRMVMPTQPEKHQPTHTGPWKVVAIGLGVVMLVLLAVIALGLVGGDDAPVDEDVPTTGVVGESDVLGEPGDVGDDDG